MEFKTDTGEAWRSPHLDRKGLRHVTPRNAPRSMTRSWPENRNRVHLGCKDVAPMDKKLRYVSIRSDKKMPVPI